MSGRLGRLGAALIGHSARSSVEADARARVDCLVDARFGGRGHGRACTPRDWWRIVLVGPVVRSDTQSEFRGLGHRCENPLHQWVGPGYAVRRHRPRYTRHGTGRE